MATLLNGGTSGDGNHGDGCRPTAGPALRILTVALLVAAPMVFRGASCGHDFDFHLLSWMEAARAWRSGVFYPHWTQYANYGAGEPRLVFYPPASWMLGGVLGGVFSWTAAPILFVLIAVVACGWSMYQLAREWLPRETASLAACLYLSNPYLLFVVYERSAFGELLAAAWLPLIVLFALRRRPSGFSAVSALGIAVAGIWLTDAPAAVLACYMLGFLAAVTSFAEKKAWPVLRAVGGVALGLGLAAFYVVPAAYEQRWIEVSRAILPGMRIQDGFLFGHTGDTLHDQVLRTASWILLVEFAAAGIAAWIAIRRRVAPGVRTALVLLLPLVLFLQFPVSRGFWMHAPDLRFVQFPWRWLFVLSVATCALIGMALPLRNRARRADARTHNGFSWLPGAACMAAIIAIIFAGAHFFFQSCDDEDAIAGQVSAFRMGPASGGVEGTDEYTPANADNSEVMRDLPLVRVLEEADGGLPAPSAPENPEWRPETSGVVPASVESTESSTEYWKILVRSRASGFAVLRLMDYPAWQVTRNGAIVTNRPHREDGLMTVPIEAGSNAIEVRWTDTADVLVGRAVSVATFLLLLVLQLLRLRTAARQEEKQLSPQVS